MSTEDLEHLRHLTNTMDHGPSGFFSIGNPPTRILFVDDEPATCRVFDRLVTKHLGVGLYIACDAAHAMEILREHHDRIAVTVADIRMPGIHNGSWLIDQIKDHWPSIMCILTTAFADTERLTARADDVIAKPWDLKRLIDELNLFILKAASGAA